jgi:predicted amidohydrolase YtcJ
VDVRQPTARALAVRGDKIVSVGSDKDIESLIGDDTRVIGLHGRLTIPGFIEGHGHFLGLGASKLMLDLTAATSWDQRFAELGVVASMQGIHCMSDAVYVMQRLGFRRASEGAYVWRSLIEAGALIANGSDAPVEDINPIECFYASVTRQLPSGVTFFPEQKMTRDEALQSYTINAAFAAFEDDIKGSLSPGRLADIVVLSDDIMSIPDEDIREAVVDYTIVGGKVVYERNE